MFRLFVYNLDDFKEISTNTIIRFDGSVVEFERVQPNTESCVVEFVMTFLPQRKRYSFNVFYRAIQNSRQ